MRQARLEVTRRTTWDRLLAQVEDLQGSACLVVGKGARARKLIERLVREVPDAMRFPTFATGPFAGEHAAIINPDGLGSPLAWGHDSSGTAPTVEATRGCPGGCDHGVP